MTDKTMDEIKPVAWMFPRRYGSGLSFNKPEATRDEEDGPLIQPTPLYDSAALAAARLEGEIAGMREAMEIVKPKDKRPCDCERCDCGNSGDAASVAYWDESNANAAAINRAIQEKQNDHRD